jgi:mono/diheme cytochrome c family protein
MRPIHALPIVLAAAAFAGCGGGDDNGGGAGTTSAAPATQTQAQAQTQTQDQTSTGRRAKGPDGAKVFASAGCGGCHTLGAAGSNGSVGPNLDDLKPDFAAVQQQVENGGGGMPAFGGDLSQQEIDAVARYVSENAGK